MNRISFVVVLLLLLGVATTQAANVFQHSFETPGNLENWYVHPDGYITLWQTDQTAAQGTGSLKGGYQNATHNNPPWHFQYDFNSSGYTAAADHSLWFYHRSDLQGNFSDITMPLRLIQLHVKGTPNSGLGYIDYRTTIPMPSDTWDLAQLDMADLIWTRAEVAHNGSSLYWNLTENTSAVGVTFDAMRIYYASNATAAAAGFSQYIYLDEITLGDTSPKPQAETIPAPLAVVVGGVMLGMICRRR